MKVALLIAFSILLLCQSVVLTQDKVKADKYKPRTLGEVIQLNRDGTDQSRGKAKVEELVLFVGMDFYYSRVKLQFVGTSRPISSEHQRLIQTWAKLQRVKKKFVSLYESEYLFKEGDAEYWIPVQKEVGENIGQIVKSGEPLNLFVIYVGAEKAPNVTTFTSLFLATAFEK